LTVFDKAVLGKGRNVNDSGGKYVFAPLKDREKGLGHSREEGWRKSFNRSVSKVPMRLIGISVL
jgi:hypothetical protein